jgi:hypothetical protein
MYQNHHLGTFGIPERVASSGFSTAIFTATTSGESRLPESNAVAYALPILNATTSAIAMGPVT